MKYKKAIIGLYLLVILGVFYFIYNALIYDDVEVPNSLTVQTEAIDQLLVDGPHDFQAEDINGKSFKLSGIVSPIFIINFWASWCGPCVEEFPSLIKLLENYKGQVTVIAISVDADTDSIKKFLSDLNLNHSSLFVLKDPQYFLAEKFGTFKIPESYIFTSDRKLIRKVSGSIDWIAPEMLRLLDENIKK